MKYLVTPLNDSTGSAVTVDTVPAPWIIPHRGGSNIVPEESMNGYRQSVQFQPFIDTDLWSLRGAGLAAMHDSTMSRTTIGYDKTTQYAPHQFLAQRMDPEVWFNANYPQTEYPVLQEDIFRMFGNTVIYTPEIKSPSTDPQAGPRLLALIQKYGLEANCVVQADNIASLSPFVGAGIATCLGSISSDSVAANFPAATLIAAGIKFVSVSYACSDATFNDYATAGLKVFAWTIDRHWVRDRLMALDNPPFGYFTNEPGYLDPDTTKYQSTRDTFCSGQWDHGMMTSGETRSKHTITPTSTNSISGYLCGGTGPQVWQMLQGYLAPLPDAGFTLNLNARTPITVAGDSLRWCGIFLGTSDRDFVDGAGDGVNGYHIIMRMSSGMSIYRITNGVGTQIANRTGQTVWPVTTWQNYQISVDANNIAVQHVSSVDPATLSVADATYRPLRYAWLNFNYNSGQKIEVGGISIS